jgi:hypothetical protein
MTSAIYVPLRWFLYDWLCAVWFVDFAIVSDALDYVRVLEKASHDVDARVLERVARDMQSPEWCFFSIFRDSSTNREPRNQPQSPRNGYVTGKTPKHFGGHTR